MGCDLKGQFHFAHFALLLYSSFLGGLGSKVLVVFSFSIIFELPQWVEIKWLKVNHGRVVKFFSSESS